jgi:hypothetical protein
MGQLGAGIILRGNAAGVVDQQGAHVGIVLRHRHAMQLRPG